MTTPSRPPINLRSVHLDFDGGDAAELRDYADDARVGSAPEWADDGRNEHAAFARGTRPRVRVVFRGTAGGTYLIGATGTPGVEARRVALTFDAATGLSTAHDFRADGDLPGVVGVHAWELRWYAIPDGTPERLVIATTTHRVFTTRDPMTGWAYRALVEWSCSWAAGKEDDKEICDALMEGIRRSPLVYGRQPRVEGLRNFLLNGGGMCGEWYDFFFRLAGC